MKLQIFDFLRQFMVLTNVLLTDEPVVSWPVMKVGDRVRIKDSVIFYHYPEHRNEAYDACGLEGTIVTILQDWHGRPISPNFPIVVEFAVEGAKKPFRAHLRDDELEVIESASA